MKFYVGIVILCLAGLAVGLNELAAGRTCSVCSQNEGLQKCCSGNELCESIESNANCVQIGPAKEDKEQAYVEFSNALYERGAENFCSICCGLASEATRCCSGSGTCSCTEKYFFPSCTEITPLE